MLFRIVSSIVVLGLIALVYITLNGSENDPIQPNAVPEATQIQRSGNTNFNM